MTDNTVVSESEVTIKLTGVSEEDKQELMKIIKKYSNKSKRWKPEYNESYFSISGYGEINRGDRWVCDEADNEYFNLRNCFKTKEEAEFELEKKKVIAELQNYADEHNDKIDWNDLNSAKWEIFYDYSSNNLSINYYYYSCNMNCIHFSSEDVAQAAIRAVGEDRIKKYIFGISEDKVN